LNGLNDLNDLNGLWNSVPAIDQNPHIVRPLALDVGQGLALLGQQALKLAPRHRGQGQSLRMWVYHFSNIAKRPPFCEGRSNRSNRSNRSVA
jgi:hypothetical protein